MKCKISKGLVAQRVSVLWQELNHPSPGQPGSTPSTHRGSEDSKDRLGVEKMDQEEDITDLDKQTQGSGLSRSSEGTPGLHQCKEEETYGSKGPVPLHSL